MKIIDLSTHKGNVFYLLAILMDELPSIDLDEIMANNSYTAVVNIFLEKLGHKYKLLNIPDLSRR